MTELVAFEARDVRRVAGFGALGSWNLWELISRPVRWRVIPRCVVVSLAITAAVVVIPPVIAIISVAVTSIVARVSPIVPIISVIIVTVIVVIPKSVAAVIAAIIVITTIVVIPASSIR
jgi:hypothetical protein